MILPWLWLSMALLSLDTAATRPQTCLESDLGDLLQQHIFPMLHQTGTAQ
jgi:hypothetical protein